VHKRVRIFMCFGVHDFVRCVLLNIKVMRAYYFLSVSCIIVRLYANRQKVLETLSWSPQVAESCSRMVRKSAMSLSVSSVEEN
jgi:hypothetical protein